MTTPETQTPAPVATPPEPVLSVIITIRNDAQTLPIALDSLLRQETDFPWDVVVTDGNSKDRSVEVIRQHPLAQRVPIHIRTLAPGQDGMTIGINVGVRLARGRIVLLMQADIRVRDPQALRKVLAAFDDPDVVATYFVGLGAGEDFAKYDFWGKVFLAQHQEVRCEDDFDTKFNGIRRDVYLDVGGLNERELAHGGADLDFWLKMKARGRIAALGIEAEHLHGFGKRHTPSGLLKKYMRNAEVAGVCLRMQWRHRHEQPGLPQFIATRLGSVAACILSLVPWLWPWSLALGLAAALYWQRHAFRLVRDWRLVYVPFFALAGFYASIAFYLRGAFAGRTQYDFDNTMR